MNPESRLVLRAVPALCEMKTAVASCESGCHVAFSEQVTYNNMGCFYKSFGKPLGEMDLRGILSYRII